MASETSSEQFANIGCLHAPVLSKEEGRHDTSAEYLVSYKVCRRQRIVGQGTRLRGRPSLPRNTEVFGQVSPYLSTDEGFAARGATSLEIEPSPIEKRGAAAVRFAPNLVDIEMSQVSIFYQLLTIDKDMIDI